LHHSSGSAINQRYFASAQRIKKFLAIQTEEVKDCGLDIVRSNDVVDGAMAEFVGRSIDSSPSDSSTCKPATVTLAVVIPTRILTNLPFANR
jgi:hypothetical protein